MILLLELLVVGPVLLHLVVPIFSVQARACHQQFDLITLNSPSVSLCPAVHYRIRNRSLVYNDIGGFQLLDLIITELKSHKTCYDSMPLIG